MVNLSSGNNNDKKESGITRFFDWLNSQRKAGVIELLILIVLVLILVTICGFVIWFAIFTDGGIPCRGLLCWVLP